MKTKKLFRILIITVIILGILAAAASILPAAYANIRIAEEEQRPVQPIENPGSTKTLSILPLYEEARSTDALIAGHGVSYLVTTDDSVILFDVGFNEGQTAVELPLEVNMAQLGISLADFDTLVISHKHPDHVGGYKFWKDGTFSLASMQIDLDGKRIFVPEPMTYPGAKPVVSSQPTVLAPGVFTTGTLSFENPAPLNLMLGVGHEQALVIHVEGQGLFIITGCGHPTIERLAARAQALYDQPVVGVLGGLHYMGQSTDKIKPRIQFLKTLDLQVVGLSPHDSDASGLAAFRQAFPDIYQEVEVGREIVFAP